VVVEEALERPRRLRIGLFTVAAAPASP